MNKMKRTLIVGLNDEETYNVIVPEVEPERKSRRSSIFSPVRNTLLSANRIHSTSRKLSAEQEEMVRRYTRDDFLGDVDGSNSIFNRPTICQRNDWAEYKKKKEQTNNSNVSATIQTLRDQLDHLESQMKVGMANVNNNIHNQKRQPSVQFLNNENIDDTEIKYSRKPARDTNRAHYSFRRSLRLSSPMKSNQNHRNSSRVRADSNISPINMKKNLHKLPAKEHKLTINTFADAVTMAREGQLARVIGEDGMNRIIDYSRDEHDTYDTYTTDLKPYVLLKIDPVHIYWNSIIIILLLFYSIYIPLDIGFTDMELSFGWEVLFTTIFFLDIGVNFITAFTVESGPDEGSVETRPKYIAYYYLHSYFLIDLLASIPWSLIITKNTTLSKLPRLIRLLRIPRIAVNFDQIILQLKTNPASIRLAQLFLLFLLMLHYLGCIYWAIIRNSPNWPGNMEDWDPEYEWDHAVEGPEWAPKFPHQFDGSFCGHDYFLGFLWAIWVTTGTGVARDPEDWQQGCFTIVATILGVMMYAFMIGCATSAINDLDTREKAKRQKFQRMREYLIQRKVSRPLIDAIINYYDYCFSRCLDEDSKLFDGLHSSLDRAMKLAINQQLILKVPMFRDITEPCLEKLICVITPRVYLPGEWVIIKGEYGEEMYFVVRGKFEVVPYANKPPIVTLTDGQSFGEMSLLMEKTRNSSVRSVHHGELMVLHKLHFIEMLDDFPIFAISLQKWAPHIRLSRGWNKVRHAIRLCRSLHHLGLTQTFESMMLDINGLQGPRLDQAKAKKSNSRSASVIEATKRKLKTYTSHQKKQLKDAVEFLP